MKKSKILIPVLSIAGLTASIAPLIAITSCGHPVVEEYTLDKVQPYNQFQKEIPMLYASKTYKFNVNYDANVFDKGKVLFQIGYKTGGTTLDAIKTIKVTSNETEIQTEKFTPSESMCYYAFNIDHQVKQAITIEISLTRDVGSTTAAEKYIIVDFETNNH